MVQFCYRLHQSRCAQHHFLHDVRLHFARYVERYVVGCVEVYVVLTVHNHLVQWLPWLVLWVILVITYSPWVCTSKLDLPLGLAEFTFMTVPTVSPCLVLLPFMVCGWGLASACCSTWTSIGYLLSGRMFAGACALAVKTFLEALKVYNSSSFSPVVRSLEIEDR